MLVSTVVLSMTHIKFTNRTLQILYLMRTYLLFKTTKMSQKIILIKSTT